MENLVKIENGQAVVSSRQVAESFEKMHKDVLKVISGIKAQNCAVTSMFFETTYTAGTGKAYKEYLMNRDGFSLLVMGFTGAKALEWKIKYIQAFNEMEQQLASQKPTLPDFANPVTAARAWADEVEQKQKALAQLEEQKPAVIFAGAISVSKDAILIGALAKIIRQNGIEIGQKRLFAWLRDNSYLIKSGRDKNMPTQRSIEMGLFRVKEGSYIDSNDVVKITRTTLVTGKGQIYFVNKFLAEQSF